jgi:hypothetical protein
MADKTNGKFIFIIQQHHHEPWKFPISILMTIYVFNPVLAGFFSPFPLLAFSLNVDDLLPFTTRGGSTYFAITYPKVFISKFHVLICGVKESPSMLFVIRYWIDFARRGMAASS